MASKTRIRILILLAWFHESLWKSKVLASSLPTESHWNRYYFLSRKINDNLFSTEHRTHMQSQTDYFPLDLSFVYFQTVVTCPLESLCSHVLAERSPNQGTTNSTTSWLSWLHPETFRGHEGRWGIQVPIACFQRENSSSFHYVNVSVGDLPSVWNVWNGVFSLTRLAPRNWKKELILPTWTPHDVMANTPFGSSVRQFHFLCCWYFPFYVSRELFFRLRPLVVILLKLFFFYAPCFFR